MTDPKKLQEDRESESNMPKNHLVQSPAPPAEIALQAASLSGSIAGRDHKALDRMRAALNVSISALSPEEILGNETAQSPQSLPKPDLRSTTSNSKGSSQSPSPPKDINLFQQQASGRFEYGSILHSYPHGVKAPTQISNHSYIASKNSKPASHENNKTRETHVSPGIPLIEFNGKISKSTPTTTKPKFNIKDSESPISKNTPDNETRTQKTPDSPARKVLQFNPYCSKYDPAGETPHPANK